jgi:hypothetical protein
MDEKTRAIAERFLWKLPAISTRMIAEILDVDQKEIIQLRQELIAKSKRAYASGIRIGRNWL